MRLEVEEALDVEGLDAEPLVSEPVFALAEEALEAVVAVVAGLQSWQLSQLLIFSIT